MSEFSELKIYAKEDRRDYRLIWEKARRETAYILTEETVVYEGGLAVLDGSFDLTGVSRDDLFYVSLDGEIQAPYSVQVVVDSSGEAKLLNIRAKFQALDKSIFLSLDAEDPVYYVKDYAGNESVPGTYSISVFRVTKDDNMVTMLVPIRLGRCDRWQLKFEGTGEVTIRAIGREHVTGSVK